MLWRAFKADNGLNEEQVNQQFINRLLRGRHSAQTRCSPVFGDVTKLSHKGFVSVIKFLIGTSTDEACQAGIDLISGDDPKLRDTIMASAAALDIALEDAEHRYRRGGTKPPVFGSRTATVEVAIKLGAMEDSATDEILPSCSRELEAANKKDGVERKVNAKVAIELIRAVRIHTAIAHGKHLKNCGFVQATGADRALMRKHEHHVSASHY